MWFKPVLAFPEDDELNLCRVIRRNYSAALLVIFTCAMLATAQPAPDKPKAEDELAQWITANYTKFEYRIAMRDGVRLFTCVYVPKDAGEQHTYPILFDRTPYAVSPYGVDQYKNALGPSELFTRSKYIFAYQDVRGRFQSEGTFEDMRPYIPNKQGTKDVDESSDAYDTIDWLIKNVHYNNGRVGVWGISYPGFYSAMAAIDAHPALKAVSPQAPIADWFIGDDFHHNGALYLPHMFNFMYTFGRERPELTSKWGEKIDHETPDGYNFFLKLEPLSNIDTRYYHNKIAWWEAIIQHPNYDQFWKARATPQFLRNLKPAMLTVGGWFDAEDLWGALHTYKSANAQSPDADVKLVMGPWSHGGWSRTDGDHLGNVWFSGKQSIFYREKIEFPFFEHHLKGTPDPQLPEAYVFETGTNQWRRYDAWPPKQAKPAALYLGPNGQLTFTKPAAGPDFDEYISDPTKPVPFITGTETGMPREHMTDDQRLAGRRTDVLVYQTAPLTEDVTLVGPLRPELFVSTSATDSDFVVKLIDVYPDNFPDNPENPKDVHLGAYQQLIRGELFRARFRNGYEKPEPFEPNKVTKVSYEMPDINHTFRQGHRIMIQVQSTWFPLVDLNPQKFVPNIYNAKPSDFQKATERLYHSGANDSHINVLLLPN
jgi:putative CocE/NonD family hydrolase